MTDKPRLIEHAFPLKQASLDSVHEKNVRHGHISTLLYTGYDYASTVPCRLVRRLLVNAMASVLIGPSEISEAAEGA